MRVINLLTLKGIKLLLENVTFNLKLIKDDGTLRGIMHMSYK